MISSWLLRRALIKKEIFLPSTKWDEWSLQRSIQSPKVTAVQCLRPLQPGPMPRPSRPPPFSPSSPFFSPSSRCSPHLPSLPTPLPTYTRADVSSTTENWIVALIYLVPFFSKRWRWPHGVVFVTSLLLPFIITGRWSPCVFSNVV